jgi:flagellar motor switch protein FliM
MSICIPYLLLKPITSKLSAQRWFASHTKKSSVKFAGVLAKRLEKTPVTCAVRLGSASLSVDELLEMQVGDVLTLDRQQHEEVEILIGKGIKFFARPGIRGKKLAVHITRVNTDTEPIHPAR